MLIRIDRSQPVPVFQQICREVARLAEEGALAPGSRLPASRVLAGRIGVNRSTVVRAYQELWALGYLESRPGSYSTIRGRGKPAGAAQPAGAGTIDWERAVPERTRALHDTYLELRAKTSPKVGGETVNFAGLAADRDLCPVEELRRCMRGVLLDEGRRLFDYGDPAGHPLLREVISRRMRVHGVRVLPEEVVVTQGSQHGLDLALRLLVEPGSRVAVESPTYSMGLPLLRHAGARLTPVPMDERGADLDVLEGALKRRRHSMIYTIPNFQNPTGITTGQAHRERLLGLCERHRVPLVEDGFEEEMKYFGKAVLPIKSMDSGGAVIYLGTFSKVVFPGLRVGWIAASGACIERLLAVSRFTTLSGNQVTQAAVARFCEEGGYERHLRRVHVAYRARMQTLLASLREHLPPGVRWTQPAGGYTLWVGVDRPPSAEKALMNCLGRGGVQAAPGSLFFPGEPTELGFRLSISNLKEDQIREGCRRLGSALRKFLGA